MQTEVTAKLKQEHQLILKYINLLGKYLRKIEEQPSDLVLLEKIYVFVDFIKTYADQYHHSKEENILFKYLEQPEVLTHCNPVPQMLYEHDHGRAYIKDLLASLDEKNLQKIIERADNWRELLSDHIFKEDNILYPMGEEGLSEEQKKTINVEYQQTEKILGGNELQLKYEKLYLELCGYLKIN